MKKTTYTLIVLLLLVVILVLLLIEPKDIIASVETEETPVVETTPTEKPTPTPTPTSTPCPTETPKEESLPSYENGAFTITIQQFIEVMDCHLNSISDNKYSVCLSDDVVNMELDGQGVLFENETHADLGLVSFSYDGEDPLYDKSTIGYNAIALAITSSDVDIVNDVIAATVMTCNPTLDNEHITSIVEQLLTFEYYGDNALNDNGLCYRLPDMFTDQGLYIITILVNAVEIDESEETPTLEEAIPTSKPEETTDTKKGVTTGERNALRAARNYLDVMAFSYSGLIEQLEYEGYTYDEAMYGADNCGADWYEQAALMAENYLDVMAFSYNGLIEQLEYEGFTYDQASYGVDQVY